MCLEINKENLSCLFQLFIMYIPKSMFRDCWSCYFLSYMDIYLID